MKNWTIARRLTVGFGAVATVAVLLGAVAFARLVPIRATAVKIKEDAVPGVALFGRITQNALTTQALSLEAALTDDHKEVAALEQEITTQDEQSNQLFTDYE